MRRTVCGTALVFALGCGRDTPPPAPPRPAPPVVAKPAAKPKPSGPAPLIVRYYEVRPPQPAAKTVAPPVPKFPLALAAPPDEPALYKRQSLAETSAGELAAVARDAAAGGDYPLAVAAQFWYAKKADGGLFALACHYARAGRTDAALYTLQGAAKEGVDARRVEATADLAGVRADPRFGQLLPYFLAVNARAAATIAPASVCHVPAKFDHAKPTAVVLLLHGHGANPDDPLGAAGQRAADRLGVPVISVSGTNATGPKSFAWALDADKDYRRLDAAVQRHAYELRFQPLAGRFVAVGVGEGARVALSVALRHPEIYAGAVAVSPDAADPFEGFRPDALLKGRSFVVAVGSAEPAANLALAQLSKATLDRLGVPAELVTPPGDPARSPDFETLLTEWVARVLAAAK